MRKLLSLWAFVFLCSTFFAVITTALDSHAASDTAAKSAPATAKPVPAKDTPAAPAKSGGLAVTDLRKEGDNYSATMNGAIVFRELTMKNGKLFFPKTGEKDDRDYLAVYLNDRTIADKIKEAITAGKATGKGSPSDLKITAVKWKSYSGRGKLKGFADITYNNAFTIKGLKILDGKNGLWLAWPSVKRGTEFVDLVFSADKLTREAAFEAVKKEAGIK